MEIFILAGGKSSRMGQDKGLMKLGEKEMILYVLETVKQLNLPVKIIANYPDYHKFGLEVFGDIIPEKGPMGGLYTALCNSKESAVFLISCDMPFLNVQAVEKLLFNTNPAEVLVSSVKGQINPLFAIYQPSLKNKILTCIEKGELKMKNLIFSSDYQIVEMDDLVAENPFLFFNLNEEKDVLETSELWKKIKKE